MPNVGGGMAARASALVVESEALHDRVRAFAQHEQTDEAFEALALAIAEFQARHSPAFARLLASRGARLSSVDDIPAVPAEAFRLTRVAVHPESLDCARFATSGTTLEARGVHSFRTTRTYAELSARLGRRALMNAERATVVALAPTPSDPPSSSLAFMFVVFMTQFDGRALEPGQPYSDRASDRWLLEPGGPNISGLRRAADVARERGEPLLVLATSLALLAVLDRLGSEQLPLPPRSVVMQTGGYKGRHVQVEPRELRRRVAERFQVPDAQVVSEYGMTELSSQLYEGTCPGASLVGPPDVYLAPPWLRLSAVDPVSLEPVAAGEVGLARFVDLANVDSAVAVLARDRIRARDGGFELLGREPGAPPRGCSLAIEALLSGASHGERAG